jgi:hypothetical protein
MMMLFIPFLLLLCIFLLAFRHQSAKEVSSLDGERYLHPKPTEWNVKTVLQRHRYTKDAGWFPAIDHIKGKTLGGPDLSFPIYQMSNIYSE